MFTASMYSIESAYRDDDVQKLRALEEDMRAFMSRYRKMALRVEALERMLSQKEKDVR